MSWSWTYAAADGSPMTGGACVATEFPTQSDAENWFGESWHELADDGVDTVTLWRDGAVVYGPMSLQSG